MSDEGGLPVLEVAPRDLAVGLPGVEPGVGGEKVALERRLGLDPEPLQSSSPLGSPEGFCLGFRDPAGLFGGEPLGRCSEPGGLLLGGQPRRLLPLLGRPLCTSRSSQQRPRDLHPALRTRPAARRLTHRVSVARSDVRDARHQVRMGVSR